MSNDFIYTFVIYTCFFVIVVIIFLAFVLYAVTFYILDINCNCKYLIEYEIIRCCIGSHALGPTSCQSDGGDNIRSEVSYLRHEDADHNSKLMQRAHRATHRRGRDFCHVHGHKAGGLTRVHPHYEASDHEHLPGFRGHGGTQERSSDDGKHVGHDHGVLPGEQGTDADMSIFSVVFETIGG